MINAIPADIGQIFRYWMIYHKYISMKSNGFFFQLFLFYLGFVNKWGKSNLSLTQISEWLKVGWLCFTFSSSQYQVLFWKMLIVEYTGNKERNIVFQKWRGTHYRKWTWSVGFQRKKYCSKCANIHFHPGENPFRESSQLIKSCVGCWDGTIFSDRK